MTVTSGPRCWGHHSLVSDTAPTDNDTSEPSQPLHGPRPIFGAELAAALVRDNFSGANIDFEPATDADDERSALNPTIADAVD
eukprot:COSAG06_NODE_8545_length_2134_cov_0.913022_4_plen_82_part_01